MTRGEQVVTMLTHAIAEEKVHDPEFLDALMKEVAVFLAERRRRGYRVEQLERGFRRILVAYREHRLWPRYEFRRYVHCILRAEMPRARRTGMESVGAATERLLAKLKD